MATEMLEAVRSVTEATHDPDLRITRRLNIGSVVQQGDLYLHHVADDHPRGKRVGDGSVQIALGTSNGARHTVEGDVEVFEGVQLPEWVTPPDGIEASEILGPVVVATKTFRMPHPEHPHHRLPVGTYQVTYQADLRTMRRVVD